MLTLNHLESQNQFGGQDASNQQNLAISLQLSPLVLQMGMLSRGGENEPLNLSDSQEPDESRVLLGPTTSDNLYVLSSENPKSSTDSVEQPDEDPASSTPNLNSFQNAVASVIPRRELIARRGFLTPVIPNKEAHMSQCHSCARNGVKREGGSLGVCWQHKKRKCLICKAPSLGEEMCAAHAHQVEMMRWKAQAQLRVIEPDDMIRETEIRHSKLLESKFLAFKAIEIMFQALHGAVVAIWGSPAAGPEPDSVEQKKAA